MHADDLGLRRQRLGSDRYARDQPAPADRHEQYFKAGLIGEHFERDRALAGDHCRIVVGMHRNEATLSCQPIGGLTRLDQALAAQHDLRTERLRTIDLGERCGGRHDNGRRNAEAARVIGNALRMVAGRHCDNAGLAFSFTEGKQLVERAALLEGAGQLHRLELQINLAADRFRECGGADQRCAADRPRNRCLGLAYIGDRDRQITHVRAPE